MLLWATYLAVMYGGLQAGIGIGIVFCTLYFAFSYARVITLPCNLHHHTVLARWLEAHSFYANPSSPAPGQQQHVCVVQHGQQQVCCVVHQASKTHHLSQDAERIMFCCG